MHISKVYSMLGIFLQVSRDMFERNFFRIRTEFEIEVYLYLDFYNLLTLDRGCTYTIIFHITDQHPYFFQFLNLWNILKSCFPKFHDFSFISRRPREASILYLEYFSKFIYIYLKGFVYSFPAEFNGVKNWFASDFFLAEGNTRKKVQSGNTISPFSRKKKK